MNEPRMPRRPGAKRAATTIAIAVLVGLLLVAVGGCSGASSAKSPAPMQSTQAAENGTSKKMMATDNSRPDVPPCYECSGKGKPPVVEGVATDDGGTQVVNIKIENGYYAPNKIAVKAGMPVRVVFSGTTKDCVGKPKFGSLDKQIDIRQTGTGSMDLGALAAGSYEFTCGMGATGGSITAQ